MIVTYNWLKEFVDVDLSPAELADLLTMLGLEVEGMESHGEGMDDVVVALVEEKLQHPNADKLSLCKVNNGQEILTIVCGAQNFKAGTRLHWPRSGRRSRVISKSSAPRYGVKNPSACSVPKRSSALPMNRPGSWSFPEMHSSGPRSLRHWG